MALVKVSNSSNLHHHLLSSHFLNTGVSHSPRLSSNATLALLSLLSSF